MLEQLAKSKLNMLATNVIWFLVMNVFIFYEVLGCVGLNVMCACSSLSNWGIYGMNNLRSCS